MKMEDTKPEAVILDATAGNRMFWKKKNDKRVLWIDIQEDLEIPPDAVIDCTDTGFPDQSFHTIIFDPPHWWGDEPASTFFTIKNKEDKEKLQEKYPEMDIHGCYYGTDIYKTKSQLIKFLHKAQLEFHRIIWDNGILWFNWCEVKINLRKVLPIFTNWDPMIILPIGSKLQTMGDSQNYWVMLMKKDRPMWQTHLGGIYEK